MLVIEENQWLISPDHQDLFLAGSRLGGRSHFSRPVTYIDFDVSTAPLLPPDDNPRSDATYVEVLAEIIAAILDVWNKNRFICGPNW